MNNYHASCVAFGTNGVLIRGASGAGKSTLALQLIDSEGYGFGKSLIRATIVADDRVNLHNKAGKLIASSPSALEGLLEIRGIGIMRINFKKEVSIKLVVDLLPAKSVERLPNQNDLRTEIEGVEVPLIVIAKGNVAAAAIVRSALHCFA